VPSSPANAFGQALREARLELGLSQEEAALACGIDRGYFGQLERSLKSPTLNTVWRLANGLNVKPSELLIRVEELVA
jgi:transcriptional regulator with XRE-family HTH domain